MSVTFAPTGLETILVDHPLDCDGQDGACAAYGCCDYVEVGLNVSNANACALMAALELYITEDLCGVLDAQDLRGRCLLALAMTDDSAIAPTVDVFPGAATQVDCGRRAGYMTDRLSALLAIAEQAASLGTSVSYF